MSSQTSSTKTRSAASLSRKDASAKSADSRAFVSPEARKILDSFQLGDVLSHLLRRAHFRAEELFSNEFAEESITPRQKATLAMLYQFPGLSQNALGERLFMDRNTVADMVRRLVSAGLIRREPAEHDKRAYELFLADAGAQMLNRVMPRDMEVEQRLAERVPLEHLPLFMECLHRLVNSPLE